MMNAEDITWVDVGPVAEGYSITFLDDGAARFTMYRDDGTEVVWTGEMTLLANDQDETEEEP